MTVKINPLLLAGSVTSLEEKLMIILIQLAVIIVVARLFGNLFRRYLRQPSAVGEIAAGIALGPSVFGWLAPGLSAMIFLPDATPIGHDTAQVLRVLSQLGLIFLLFLMGLQFDFSHLKTNVRGAIGVSITGIVLPLMLGIGLAHLLHPYLASTTDERGFRLFMGTAMSITALPMLARMMQELNITRTRLGAITITAAAVDDAAGWILLATVTALIQAKFHPSATALMVVETIGFTLFMVYIARPFLRRWIRSSMAKNNGELSLNTIAMLFVALFSSSILTSLIGIFAIFGAFIFGSILSEEEEFRLAASRLLQRFVTVFFLPIFFTYTGLQTNVGLLHTPLMWLFAAAVSIVAITGKFGGCSLAAYWGGFSRAESLCIGSLMNTRALMELIVINVGYELGVIPQTVFSMLVLMALLTTIMTTPLLFLFMKGTELEPYLERWFNQPRKMAV
jgi:Kef-type K+ transport system membrane component KefB